MNTTDFWSLIDAARTDAARSTGGPEDTFASALIDRLAATSKQTVFEFEAWFERVDEPLYRWDVWAAAYLIGGGCSDDSFMDFRAALIAQGRDWYEMAVASPDTLAEHPDVITAAAEGRDQALFNESINYAASKAYQRITGEDDDCFYDKYDDFRGPQPDSNPSDMGEDFNFDDASEMHARLPRLASLFLSDDTP